MYDTARDKARIADEQVGEVASHAFNLGWEAALKHSASLEEKKPLLHYDITTNGINYLPSLTWGPP